LKGWMLNKALFNDFHFPYALNLLQIIFNLRAPTLAVIVDEHRLDYFYSEGNFLSLHASGLKLLVYAFAYLALLAFICIYLKKNSDLSHYGPSKSHSLHLYLVNVSLQ